MKEYSALTIVPVTMSSREIAELTGKRHRDVLRDIDNLLESLSADLRLGFKSSTYKDSTGKDNRMFQMDRDSSYCLVAGYDANARMRIIKRWQELEAAQQSQPAIANKPKTDLAAFRATPIVARGLKALGLDKILTPNAFALSVDTTVRKVTGLSALEMSGNLHLIADERGRVYTPTELGKMLVEPLSAVKFNLALEAAGLQKRELGEWMPTDDAKGLFEWADTAKRHSDGTPVKQLRWFKTALSRLALSAEVA